MTKIKVLKFKSETTPWRVPLPAKWFPDGKRKSKYFRYKQDAAEFAKACNDNGRAALESYVALVPKVEQDQFETTLRWLLSETGGDFRKVHEAWQHYKLTRANVKSATIREAVEAFQAFRRSEKDEATVRSDGGRLAKLISFFPDIQLSELGKPQLMEFFDSMRKTYKDVLSIYKSVHVFFVWAHERGYIGQIPFEKGTRKKMGTFGVNNEFYPIETFRSMLRIVAGLEAAGTEETPTRDFISLLPWFVISGFAGLRSSEAFRDNLKKDSLKWSDLFFTGVDEPHIHVSETVAKGGRPRGVDMVPALEAIQAWLPLCERKGNHIVMATKSDVADLVAEFKRRTGIKFLKNGFRNSFATYALSYSTLSGLGYVSGQMGDSEAICKRHYAKWLPTGSGKRWFEGVRPDQPANVISIVAA
jgi:hypothetical protein